MLSSSQMEKQKRVIYQKYSNINSSERARTLNLLDKAQAEVTRIGKHTLEGELQNI